MLQLGITLNQAGDLINDKAVLESTRRQYIWDQLRSLREKLQKANYTPTTESITQVLSEFDVSHVREVWMKALDRQESDPAGAITIARNLIETVCKSLLDVQKISYDDSLSLPKLYHTVAETLNLSPKRDHGKTLRQILGSCQSVVEGLGAIRNQFGDAHGKGKELTRPDARHAELAVNLAGAMTMFLVRTWEEQYASDKAL